jgi:hypothetical protein
MKSVSKRLLYWVPRILTILFAAFISIFALDVFSEHLSFWRLMLALVMHLVPTFIVLIVLALAWKWEWIGAVGYFAVALLYIYWAAGRFPRSVYVAIAGPPFLIGTLFLLNWIFRSELHAHA